MAGTVLRHRPPSRALRAVLAASRCSAYPASLASPVVALADARDDRAERLQRDHCVRVSRARLRHRARASMALPARRGATAPSASSALRAALADLPEPQVAMLADARGDRHERFPRAVPCRTPREYRNREPPRNPRTLFNLRGGDARQRDAPASPVATPAVTRADRDERLQGNERVTISRSPSASR